MNCSEVQENLSAYYDGELSPTARRKVDDHLALCKSCCDELRCFVSLSGLAKQDIGPAVPDDLWRRIERGLEEPSNGVSRPSETRPGRRYAGLLGLAAGLLITVTGTVLWYRAAGSGTDRHAMPDLVQFASLLRRDPAAAQQMLLAAYAGKPISRDQAVQGLGYMPVALRRIPDGYRLHSTYSLDMPCCQCMQVLYERGDGGMIAVFEQSSTQPFAAGDRFSVCTECNGQPCRLMQADGWSVVSCQIEDRQLAIVGAADKDEAHALLAWLQENTVAGLDL
ncbi:MAG: zf-HC2 domain-containing protein [Pirellulaceae bacterium]|nr:zf-HC2 domain-containing protein [Pirellulaceae bacterium]